MPGNRPTPAPAPSSRPHPKRTLTWGWESVGNGVPDDPDQMGTPREPAGNAGRANRRMYLPLLTTLSGGSSTPIPDEDWPAVVDAALDGDPDAARQLFAAAARWSRSRRPDVGPVAPPAHLQ
jgi:hypothetical protein